MNETRINRRIIVSKLVRFFNLGNQITNDRTDKVNLLCEVVKMSIHLREVYFMSFVFERLKETAIERGINLPY